MNNKIKYFFREFFGGDNAVLFILLILLAILYGVSYYITNDINKKAQYDKYTIENGIEFTGKVTSKHIGRGVVSINVEILSPEELKGNVIHTRDDYRVDEIVKGKYTNLNNKDWYVIEEAIK